MILEIVLKFLKEKKEASFEEIFSEIQLQLESKWKRNFEETMNMDKIIAKKKGELFGYLNTDGRFIMLSDKRWSLTHRYSYDKIRKLRATIIQNSEL